MRFIVLTSYLLNFSLLVPTSLKWEGLNTMHNWCQRNRAGVGDACLARGAVNDVSTLSFIDHPLTVAIPTLSFPHFVSNVWIYVNCGVLPDWG